MRVTLVGPAPTPATAAAAFPAGEDLDERGRAWAAQARVPRADRLVRGPEPACVQTCAAFGIEAAADPSLAGWDLGTWAGTRLEDLARERPDDVTAWLTDPDAAPHGGEPLRALLARARAWLAALPDGHTLAVCDTALARAAVVGLLDAPPAAFWRIDAGPLTATDLRGGPDRWTVRATGTPLRP
jgi:broad specificity phosphatase PhoE